MKPGRNLVLLSGGLDSAVNFLIALKRGGVGLALTVDYGQRAARREVEKAASLCAGHGVRHEVIDAQWLGYYSKDALTTPGASLPSVRPDELAVSSRVKESMRAVWVPNRNGLLVNIGACVAEALGMKYVVMGLNAEEGATFPDNSPGFVREINRALSSSTLSKVRLRSFTMKSNKMEILRMAIAFDLDFRGIWSCYNGEEFMCGSCESCARLLAAAEGLGETDRLEGVFKLHAS